MPSNSRAVATRDDRPATFHMERPGHPVTGLRQDASFPMHIAGRGWMPAERETPGPITRFLSRLIKGDR